MMFSKKIDLSIVVPVYCSAEIIPILVKRIDEVFLKKNINVELLLVDDGSSDDSFSVIQLVVRKCTWVRGFKHSRNFGQQAAIWTGLTHSKGEVVGIMDDDMQDPPEALLSLYQKIGEGYDVVYGVRKNRSEPLYYRLLFKLFYRIINSLSSISIPLDAGDFSCMRRNVVSHILSIQDVSPYLRGIRAWVGFRQIGFAYDRKNRLSGNSGYNLFKYLLFALTGIFSFSYSLLRIVGAIGVGACIIDFFVFIVLMIMMTQGTVISPFTWITVIILFVSGVQLISLGVVGEYLNKTYHQTKKWPISIVSEEV